MVFSKDAYSSGRCGTAGKEKQGRRLYLLIFFRAFFKESVALVVAGRKNAQLFHLA